jgi:hypothetical protein
MIYRQGNNNQNIEMTQTLTKLNKLVISFLETNQDNADVAKEWMSTANQNAVGNLLNKNEKTVGKFIDPNAPKRGKSAYLFFCNAMRDKVKKTLGVDSKATDVTRELGVQWNTLKEDTSRRKELAKYETMATEDKARYEQERDTYVPDESALITKKPRRVKAAPTGPKRAKSAYLFFCTEMRDKVRGELEDNSATNVTRELGVRWNTLKEQGKVQKYQKQAQEDKARYEKEKAEGVVATAKGTPKAAPAKDKAPAKAPAKAAAATPKTAPAKGRGSKVAAKK